MEFGLKQLKLLRNVILEIADANNIPMEEAAKKFFKDIEDQYDDKLGFESKKHQLQEEVNNLAQQKLKLFAELNAIPRLASAVTKLISIEGNKNNNGIEEFEILVDKVRIAGGIRAATQKLNGQLTDTTKSAVLSDDNNHSAAKDKENEKGEQLVDHNINYTPNNQMVEAKDTDFPRKSSLEEEECYVRIRPVNSIN